MTRPVTGGGPSAGGSSGRSDADALAEALVVAQRWDSALQVITPALASDPGDARMLGLLVRTLRGLGRRGEAFEAAQRMLAVSPDDPYTLRLATLALLDVGWVDTAIGLAERSVALDPTNPANHLTVSRAWAQSTTPGASSHQLAAAREAVRLDPASPDGQIQIGVALAALADVEAARAAYRTALELDPGNPAALNNLAVLDLQAGAHDAAARNLAAALASDPHGSVPQRNLDTVTVHMVRRVGWWLAVAPLPALFAAALGASLLAALLAVAALLSMPLVALRWWRALTPGQRRAARTLPRRVGATTWVWPGTTAILGGLAACSAVLAPGLITGQTLAGYLVVLGYLALFRFISAVMRPTWRAEMAARSARWRRTLGHGG